MEIKQCIRTYAKRRHGAYPEVDNFILVDLAADPKERYLVDGELFARNLAEARGIMAERLHLKDPKLVDATEATYTPARGYKYKTTDEGKQTMNATTQQPNSETIVAATPADMLATATNNLNQWLAANPEPAKGTEERNTWIRQRTTLKMRAAIAKNRVDGKPLPGRKAGTPNVSKETIVTKAKNNTPAPKSNIIQQPAKAPAQPKFVPMTIETSGVKITVNSAEQMDLAIGSLKKHQVI